MLGVTEGIFFLLISSFTIHLIIKKPGMPVKDAHEEKRREKTKENDVTRTENGRTRFFILR